MVGDWVICNYYLDKPFYHQFSVADFQKLGFNYCEPIPLTQSILEANGWIVKKNHVQKGNFGDSPLMLWHLTENKILRNFVHEMEISDLSSDEGYRLRFRCDYVHELQHALRLCGLNDLADNFKVI